MYHKRNCGLVNTKISFDLRIKTDETGRYLIIINYVIMSSKNILFKLKVPNYVFNCKLLFFNLNLHKFQKQDISIIFRPIIPRC